MNSYAIYVRVLVLTLLIKIGLAVWLPMSGDEAYFIVWAQHWALGYYDHPPMVGWMLALLGELGHAQWLMRLPAVLASTLIGMLMYRMLAPQGERQAAITAALFLVWPMSILNVLITTDTPLILFVFLSVYMLVSATMRDKWQGYAWSGVWLGLAFLSKYFAVLLGLAYLVWFVFTSAGRKRWRGGVFVVMAALPAVAINVYWNMTHCWDNILFNLYNRNVGEVFSWKNFQLFMLTILYLTTPPALWVGWRAWQVKSAPNSALYAIVFIVPMGFFMMLSLGKTIGLHWVLAFYPFYFLWLGSRVSEIALVKIYRFMRWFSAAHVALVLALLIAPAALWAHYYPRGYSGYVMLMQPQAVLMALKPELSGFVLATNDYSTSAVMAYHTRQRFIVYGLGSKHARQDDMDTDFRDLNGRNIVVFDKSPTDRSLYTPYFAQVAQQVLRVNGAQFYIAKGYGFDYAAYRAGVLSEIKRKYYRIPNWLPVLQCYFCEKYFAQSGLK